MDRAPSTAEPSTEAPTEPVDAAELPELSKRSIVASVVKRGGPRLLEASFIPTALFWTALTFGSLGAAYLVAIAWTYGCLGRRLYRGAEVTGVLVLASVGITIRTGLAVASGSSFVYFAQPIIGTVITAGVFFVSIALGRPLIAKLAHDFWPITPEQSELPRVRRLMIGLTILWACVNLATASTTLVLLLSLDLHTFLAAKQITGLAITISAIAVTIAWSHRTACAEGIIAPSTRRRGRRSATVTLPAATEPALLPLAA